MGVKYRQADVAGAAANGSILFRRRCQQHAEGAVASGLEGAGASSSRVQLPLEGADERVRAERVHKSRSPRSPPTVDAEGKRSPDVQLNALFRHVDAAAILYSHDADATRATLAKILGTGRSTRAAAG